MWIPGSGESQALSEVQEDRPLLHPCHLKHVAVCQEETLAFIELQPPVTPKLNGLSSPRQAVTPDAQCITHTLSLNGYRHALFELNDMKNGCHRTDNEHETTLNLNSHTTVGDGEPERTEKPQAVTPVCRPPHTALSLPLSFPLSSLYTNPDSWESQLPCSPSSPEGPGFQSPNFCQLQRRTSQGSVKEKSIRECASHFIIDKIDALYALLKVFFWFPGRKMQVYSPDSTSDESLSSPILDYIFPGPFASFLEEDLSGLSSLEAMSSPSSTDGATDLPGLSHDDIFNLPTEPLQIIEDSILGMREDSGSVEMSSATGGEHFVTQSSWRPRAATLLSLRTHI